MGINIPVKDDIKKHLITYERIRALIENDEARYETDMFCLSLPNEPANAKNVRRGLLKKSFKNITHDLLNATKDAIFNEEVRFEFEGGESNPLSQWIKNVTLSDESKIPLTEYAADVVTYGLRAYGHVWTVIDKPALDVSSFEEELTNGAPYLCNIYPGNVLNYEVVDGRLVWFAYKCPYKEPWIDPLRPQPAGSLNTEIRIWTLNEYYVIRGGQLVEDEIRVHNFGFVPVVYQSFILPPDNNSIVGISPFFTSSNLIIYANNMQSVADMELFKHGSSVLLVQENAVSSVNTEVDEKGVPHTKIQDARGYNKYVYSGEHPPQYLTKDLQAVDKANKQAEGYFLAAVQNERTLQSVSTKRATVRETGVTKTFDSEPARAALRATAKDLEAWCVKVLSMTARLLGQDQLVDSYICEFPDRFIIGNSADDKFKRVFYMLKTKYPSETGMKEAYKALTPDIAHDNRVRDVINTEIESADVEVYNEDEVQKEVDKEMSADVEFKESISGMSDDDKLTAIANRRLI